ncbi:MAG: hypothetical protein H7061_01150 [Bdellovibrionaceae bacterium]|nr:hypothetical protein [Bdellovibrio sp.]
MKALILFLTVTLGSVIVSAGEITYDYPQVNGLRVNNACYTESTFRSLTSEVYCSRTAVVSRQACRMGGEAEICRDIKEGGRLYSGEYLVERTSCVKTDYRFVEVSRYASESRCTKWAPINEADHGQCLEYGNVTVKLGTTFNVATWEHVGGEQGGRFLGYTRFEMPACN